MDFAVIGCIIQARMSSSRLPGKVMMKVTAKHPVLYFVIKQLQHSKKLESVVVATTKRKEDDVIVDYVKKLGINFFRGNELDVLDRYYQCAKKFALSSIVRIPADKPLIDPEIVDLVIGKFQSNSFDYVSNFLTSTFPCGTEVEVFTINALKKAWKEAKLQEEREHVTPYIYKNREIFKIANVSWNKNLSKLRWAVDWPNDLKLVKIIVKKIRKRPILMKDILNLLSKEPELIKINKNVKTNVN